MALACSALGQGTEAGTMITNTATLTFEMQGSPGLRTERATVVTRVDERLDGAVASLDGGVVTAASPASPVATFELTNSGNGSERFRLSAVTDLDEGGFDPQFESIYLESNGIAGLQLGAGGDRPYAGGGDDPLLGSGERLTVHVQLQVPALLSNQAEGAVALHAVPRTIVDATGLIDPTVTSFPQPGAAYAGQGDLGVTAVAGPSHARPGTLSGTALVQIEGEPLRVRKTVLGVDDGAGGSRVVSGARVIYEIQVQVDGEQRLDDVVVEDVLPQSLAYVAGSLRIDGIAEDDDFQPATSDSGGFDAPQSRLQVALGPLQQGDGVRRVTFAATVR